MNINLYKKFVNYAEKVGDFTDGKCTIDLRDCDEIIIGAMLESYFAYAYQLGIRDYKKGLKEKAEQEEFERQQPELWGNDNEKI